ADPFLVDEMDEESDTAEEEAVEAEEITFALERDMQSALRANITQLEAGLKIIDGGKERTTEAGRIDITAMDDQGNVVVVELKAGRAGQKVITQVLAYMGAVAETDAKPVRGIIVAGDFHKQVVLASRAVPTLQLRRYTFHFSFQPVK
ncbi:MAG TPA: endonuclease NucS domain-containing protein, partial [Planctomycetota bacterium]|nr:endonuclease NucS domain-containing protein [Planctomycetota bacterium]